MANILRMSALRQAIALSFIFILITILSGMGLSYFVKQELDEIIFDELAYYIDTISPRLGEDNAKIIETLNTKGLETPEVFFIGLRQPDGIIIGPFKPSIFDLTQSRTFRQSEAIIDSWHLPENQIDRVFSHSMHIEEDLGPEYIWAVRTGQTPYGTLVVGTPKIQFENKIFSGLHTFRILSILACVLALLTGLIFGLMSQKRFNRIGRVLKSVADGDLKQRVGIKKPKDDLDDLSIKIDKTIERLDILVQQQKQLSINLAHDLKTPLTRLRHKLDMALETHSPGPDIEGALEETDRIISTFDALMRLARISSGHGRAAFVEFNLGEFAQHQAEIFGPVLEDAGQNFHIEILDPQTVVGDPRMLQQAVANLFQNAMRYAGAGADVTLRVFGSQLTLSDTGAGIPDKDIPRLLRPLEKADNSRSTEGLGLGLAMVKAIADLHEAELTLANSPNGGLCVTISLPGNDRL